MVNPEPFSLQPPPEETRAEAVERKARASGDALRDRGLEYATRRNGVPMHNLATEAVCKAAGVRFERTKAGRLWIEAWAVAVISTLRGKPDTLKTRVLKHYVAAPEEERAALLTVWRTGSRVALKAMVDPARWVKSKTKQLTPQQREKLNTVRSAKRMMAKFRSGQQELP
jgi:hypothetical protein